MSTEATNPVDGEDTAAATLDPAPEVDTEGQDEAEQLFDDDGNPIEGPDEDEEVELDDDLKLKVPKDQAQKVRDAMLRQADYTRKTQELAEQRRTFDTERQNIAQATNQELALFADATALGRELATFQKVDWNAWHQQAQATYDPDEVAKVQSAFMRYQQVKDQAQKVRDAMLRQADYTRKTQELAEQRRTFDTERQNIAQATNQELALFADATALGRELATFQKVDWNAWNNQAQATYDPDEVAKVQSAFMRYQQVKDLHANTVTQLAQMENQRKSATQQETAKRVEEGRATLAREIGWNDELKAKLTDYALGQGLSRDDLSDLEATPAAAKILRDAYEGHQARLKSKAAKRHETAQQVQPAAAVAARSSPPAALDDRQSVDAWMQNRNKQVRKRA